jgi:hypothetical protein
MEEKTMGKDTHKSIAFGGQNIRKLAILWIIFLGFTLASTVQAIAAIYVSPDGNNTTGDSWTNAFTNIQTAINSAAAGGEIWVKQGTYD